MMKPKMPPKGNPNVYKMGTPEVGINLQPDGFKVQKKARQHRRF
jgi:hypothetical protein